MKNKESLTIMMKKIEERKKYLPLYYKYKGLEPHLIIPDVTNYKDIDKSGFKEYIIEFEQWLLWYKREERLNGLLGE